MKKLLALMLALLMVVSLAACGETDYYEDDEDQDPPKANTVDKVTEPTDGPTDGPADGPTESVPAATSNITFFMISINKADGSSQYLMAIPGDGDQVDVDVNVDSFVKRGTLDTAALVAIEAAFESSGLKNVPSSPEGVYTEDYASIYVSYADGTFVDTALYGDLPAEFVSGFDTMIACFQELTVHVPAYVAKPVESGDIADSDRAALDAILANLKLVGSADTYAINAFPKDEYFAMSMNLSSDAGVASGLQFTSMNMSTAYGLYIATLESGASANTVAGNFEAGIDWLKWVCVQPESAYIAINGNQVLLLLGSLEFFDATVTAIEAAGWTVYKTLTNPNL